MTAVQFSLMWNAHNKTISNGLSSLQQNGEFVDMTLAADGHHVKVHQLIMALASPYIKELIASTQCQHPVIFLNKITYTTLCTLLEYIYTGEVLVETDHLPDLVEAGKELHIQGLKDMKLEIIDETLSQVTKTKEFSSDTDQSNRRSTTPDDPLNCSKADDAKSKVQTPQLRAKMKILQRKFINQQDNLNNDMFDDGMDHKTEGTAVLDSQPDTSIARIPAQVPTARIQYTVSCHGAIQMVLNRYSYYMRNSSKRVYRSSGRRRLRWRCSSYDRFRCSAAVYTEGDVVVKRIAAHNHPFHDKKISKLLQQCAVYSAISEAEAIRQNIILDQSTPVTSKKLENFQKKDTDRIKLS